MSTLEHELSWIIWSRGKTPEIYHFGDYAFLFCEHVPISSYWSSSVNVNKMVDVITYNVCNFEVAKRNHLGRDLNIFRSTKGIWNVKGSSTFAQSFSFTVESEWKIWLGKGFNFEVMSFVPPFINNTTIGKILKILCGLCCSFFFDGVCLNWRDCYWLFKKILTALNFHFS